MQVIDSKFLMKLHLQTLHLGFQLIYRVEKNIINPVDIITTRQLPTHIKAKHQHFLDKETKQTYFSNLYKDWDCVILWKNSHPK